MDQAGDGAGEQGPQAKGSYRPASQQTEARRGRREVLRAHPRRRLAVRRQCLRPDALVERRDELHVRAARTSPVARNLRNGRANAVASDAGRGYPHPGSGVGASLQHAEGEELRAGNVRDVLASDRGAAALYPRHGRVRAGRGDMAVAERTVRAGVPQQPYHPVGPTVVSAARRGVFALRRRGLEQTGRQGRHEESRRVEVEVRHHHREGVRRVLDVARRVHAGLRLRG